MGKRQMKSDVPSNQNGISIDATSFGNGKSSLPPENTMQSDPGRP